MAVALVKPQHWAGRKIAEINEKGMAVWGKAEMRSIFCRERGLVRR